MSFKSDWEEFGQTRDELKRVLQKECGIDVALDWCSDRLIDFHYWLLAASLLSGASEEFLRGCDRSRVAIKSINVLEALYGFWMGCQGHDHDCPARRRVRFVGARTAYAENSRRANAPLLLCPECQRENYDYWRERWDDYHADCC